MNKLLKLVGMVLLMTAVFSCESEDTDSSGWARVGDTFTVVRFYDAERTTFDFTGLGFDDSSRFEVDAKYMDSTGNTLLDTGIEFYDGNGNVGADWKINDIDAETNGINRPNVTTDIYKQTFSDKENSFINFNIDNTATKVLISVYDTINGYQYFLEGNHNGNGVVTMVDLEIEQD